MFEVDKMSSFFTKLSKNNMEASDTPDTPHDGGHRGVSDAPVMLPCYFCLRTKITFPIKCIVFFKEQK